MRRPQPLPWLAICFLLCSGCWAVAWGEEVKLAEDPALSPDGETLVFAWHGDLWRVASGGGVAKRLTFSESSESSAKFSPDGSTIAFVSDRSGSSQVYTMSLDGGEPVQLTFHTEGFGLEQWSSDGEHLLVSGERDHFWRRANRLFLIENRPRSKPRLLFDDYANEGSLSVDGESLLFSREGTRWWRKGYYGSQASQVWKYEISTGEFAPLIKEAWGARHPLWVGESRRFVYVSNREGNFELWRRDLESGTDEPLTSLGEDSIVQPAISADGRVVVFRRLFDLYRLDLSEEQPRPKRLKIEVQSDETPDPMVRDFVTSASEVAFTDDGLEMAMIAGGDLWVMDTELREPVRVTSTAQLESQPVFSSDGSKIFFLSEAENQTDIWVAERSDPEAYWWLNDSFELNRLTDDSQVESGLKLSPDGGTLGYVKGRGDLWLMDLESERTRRIVESWNPPDFDFSSDSRWVTYSNFDNEFNRDIWILGLEKGAEPVNVSRHPDNDYGPVWSPDGSAIAFTGRRIGDEVDIYFVYVNRERDEQTERDRRLEEAIETIQKSRKEKPIGAGELPQGDESQSDGAAGAGADAEGEQEPESEAESEPEPLVVDLDGIHLRVQHVSIPGTREGSLFWSADSQRLGFVAEIDGKSGVYTIKPGEDLTPELLSPTVGQSPVWLEQGEKIVWLVNGTPAWFEVGKMQGREFSFRARHEYDRREKYAAGFVMAWREMRDHFYDEDLNHKNWNAIRRKYEGMAREAGDHRTFSTVVNLMLGELNGSHLGFSPARESDEGRGEQWRETTVHLGLRFEPGFAGPGLKVRDVIFGGPTDQDRSRVAVGEVVLSINGVEVDGEMNLTEVLSGNLEERFVLRVQGADGVEREVEVAPVTYGAAQSLLYEHWVRGNQQRVDEASGGKLGYLHIRGMNMSSFYRFEQDLYAVGAGKDGLVIDVRENGGGFTTDLLLTALTQPVHAITVPRGGGPGYPHDRKVYASWHKPIIVLCNQNSFSNAEIFSHAIKTLGRGKVVGVPTAGGVISTGAAQIMDLGRLRMPFRGWYLLNTGEDMELNGAVPDFILWPQPGEMPGGVDVQLDKAVEELLLDVKAWQERERPVLKDASDREPPQ